MNRRSFLEKTALTGAGILVGAVSLSSIAESATKHIDTHSKKSKANSHKIIFQEAKNNPKLRLEYINKISEPYLKLAYIKEISYLNANIQGQEEMHTVYILGQAGSQQKLKICIMPSIFDNEILQNDNDFLSALVDHEIEGHAKKLYYGYEKFSEDDFILDPKKFGQKKLFAKRPLQATFELEAYGNQLNNAVSRGMSNQFLETAVLRYYEYYCDLYNPSASNIINQQKLEELKVEYFIPILLKMRFKDLDSGTNSTRGILDSAGMLMMPYGLQKPSAELYKKIQSFH